MVFSSKNHRCQCWDVLFFNHRLPAILSIRPLKKTSLELIKPLKLFIWLVVWNIFIFPSSLECHPPNWRTHIFQRGRSTTNQKQQSFSRPIGVFFDSHGFQDSSERGLMEVPETFFHALLRAVHEAEFLRQYPEHRGWAAADGGKAGKAGRWSWSSCWTLTSDWPTSDIWWLLESTGCGSTDD